MRILIFNWRDIAHPWAGGAERHLYELAKNWTKKGHHVSFIVGGYKGALKREVIEGVEMIRVGGTYSSFILGPIWYLFSSKRERFDCLIDTAHGIPYFTPLFSRLPIVLIIHHDHTRLWNTEFNGYFAKMGMFLEQKIVPALYKNKYVVTLSNTEKEHLKHKGFNKVYAIPPGTDIDSNNVKITKTSLPVILYIGRLRRYKRVDLLLDIFPQLRKKVKGLKLVIAGDGQDRARIEHIVRKKRISNKVIMKGFVSEEEKKKLLSSSWVLAFPSLMEGWGLVAMEAASFHTPTVGFKVPGVMDAVSHGVSGLLASNTEEYVDYLYKVINNKRLRLRLSRGAYKWSKGFTWEKCSSDFLKIIRKATNGKK